MSNKKTQAVSSMSDSDLAMELAQRALPVGLGTEMQEEPIFAEDFHGGTLTCFAPFCQSEPLLPGDTCKLDSSMSQLGEGCGCTDANIEHQPCRGDDFLSPTLPSSPLSSPPELLEGEQCVPASPVMSDPFRYRPGIDD